MYKRQFRDNAALQSIALPDTVTIIAASAFRNCDALLGVDLGQGVTTVDDYAFYDCDALRSFTFSDSVTSTGNQVLRNCDVLAEVRFSANWTSAGTYTVANCPQLTEIELPEGLTTVPKSAFRYCTNLLEARLPSTLLTIEEYAFGGCTGLKGMDFNDGLTTISNSAFQGCVGFTEIDIPDSVGYLSGFNGCTNLISVKLQDGITTIGDSAFEDCVGISKILFPDNLREIGGSSFEGCTNLTSANLPNSVEIIGEEAFLDCENLSEFRYPMGWTTVERYNFADFEAHIFEGCVSLSRINVPEGVTKIPDYAFDGAEHLKEAILPSTLEEIGVRAFEDCTDMMKIYIPSSVTVIADSAFSGCTNLKIYCEYGSVALQYAIDNGFPYFYLSLTDASTPSGTLYMGDSFVLYGYVRSSDAISNVTGTIYDASGTALQTVALAPNVTDYNLNGTYNASLKFGTLALGNYTYELVATAGEETETLARSAFTIVPPPLRIYVSGLNIPEGLLDTGDGFSIGGTVVSNYAISSLSISLYTADGVQRYENTVYPGTLTYALADLAGEIPIASLPVGEYRIRIQATAKGETRLLSDKTFQPVDLDESIDEETLAAVIAFVSDPENATLFPSDYVNTSLGKMDFDTILIMAVNGRMDWLYGLASTIFAENHENQYLVELYENELSAIISDLNPDTIVLENIGETEKMFANAFLEFDITAFEAYKQGMLDRFNFKDGEIQKAYMDYLDSDFKEVISALDDVKTGLKGVAMSVELANNLANGMCNYLNGIEIMAMVVESVDGGNNPEFRTAAMRLYSKYKSESLNILLSAMETFASECLEWSVDEIISAMASLASQTNSYINGATLYNIVNFAIDASMAITGYNDIAKDYQTFMIQVETYSTGRSLYEEAFMDVRGGDTSARTVNQLLLSFTYARQASLRIHETICDLTSTSSAEEQAIREYIRMLEETAIVD